MMVVDGTEVPEVWSWIMVLGPVLEVREIWDRACNIHRSLSWPSLA